MIVAKLSRVTDQTVLPKFVLWEVHVSSWFVVVVVAAQRGGILAKARLIDHGTRNWHTHCPS